jgi:lipoyl(octanoyl) transferase
MEGRVEQIRGREQQELVWLLEHPPIYTAGTSALDKDLLDTRFPVYKTGRGGQYTYHGPGQRVAYVMKDLRKNGKEPDLKKYIYQLEEWVMRSLLPFGLKGGRREGRTGIWLDTPEGERKIAAIGVRVRRWVTYHGVAVNVSTDLSHYSGIVPCGISDYGVTSISNELGRNVSLEEYDRELKRAWVC